MAGSGSDIEVLKDCLTGFLPRRTLRSGRFLFVVCPDVKIILDEERLRA